MLVQAIMLLDPTKWVVLARLLLLFADIHQNIHIGIVFTLIVFFKEARLYNVGETS